MDFFDLFPIFQQSTHPALKGRSLRLLSLSGIAYDKEAYYFELSPRRYWVNPPGGKLTIGVRGAQVRPRAAPGSPLELLLHHIHEDWGSKPNFFPSGSTYLLEDDDYALLKGGNLQQQPDAPHLIILTAPRLGGGKMPDALAQAIYFLQLAEAPITPQTTGLLKIKHNSLGDFLSREQWTYKQLEDSAWAEVLYTEVLPTAANLRPVLAVRGLAQLWQAGLLPSGSTPASLEQKVSE